MAQEILQELRSAIINGDEDLTAAAVKKALDKNLSPQDIMAQGLSAGMRTVGAKFETGEYFLSDMLVAADAFYVAYNIIKPHLEKEQIEKKAKIVMGVVAGDIHTIGKDVVVPVLQSEGFDVVDIGIDVPAGEFIKKAKETGAQFIFISSFLSETTFTEIPKIIEEAKRAGIRDEVKIFVGGPATTTDFATKVGADGWGKDAWDALRLTKRWLQR